ncbi:hypothetical protein GmHk_17G049308 [Glycine max]|nr:hypothetical protein GmHk_17G049308 [Glycine max]
MEMEWCSHCCRLCPSRLETIYANISVNSCHDFEISMCFVSRVCGLCGKVLLDLTASLLLMFSNKKTNESSRRKKRECVQKEESVSTFDLFSILLPFYVSGFSYV